MLITIIPITEGKRIVKYYGIVSGRAIIGANVFYDLFTSIRDIVGGRPGSYEEVLRMAKDTVLREMETQAARVGANVVIGVDSDYETVGGSGSMLMVSTNGTAVKIEEDQLITVFFYYREHGRRSSCTLFGINGIKPVSSVLLW